MAMSQDFAPMRDFHQCSHGDYRERILQIATQMKYGQKDPSITPTPLHMPFPVDEGFDKSRFANLSKDEILHRLGRKRIHNLTLLKPLVDIMKYKTSKDGVSLCPISTTAKLWNLIYQRQQNVSNVLQTAQRVGLLLCTDSSYQFNGCSDHYNHSKIYAYNKSAERKLSDLFQEFDIRCDCHGINSSYMSSIVQRFKNAESQTSLEHQQYLDCMEALRIRVTQQTLLPLSKDSIIKGLNEVYPQHHEMLKTIDADNETLDLVDYDYAIPNLTYNKSGKCIRIGLRKTNAHCNLKANNIDWESLSDKEKERTRKGVIIERLGAVNENDVKSSIYRITHLLNHGIWLGRQYDLYPMMAGFHLAAHSPDRERFKAPLAMKLYFSPSVDKIIASSTFQHTQTKIRFKEWNAKAVLTEAQKRMFDVIGPSYRSEIFLHESCIYTQVAHRIRSLGYKLIQIYDGFFTDKPLREDQFEEIVAECAMEYYRKWKGYWHSWES